jgi:hypothetical protein
MGVIFECVNFDEADACLLSKEQFVEKYMSVLWQDRNEGDRRKMLEDAHDVITKGAGQ